MRLFFCLDSRLYYFKVVVVRAVHYRYSVVRSNGDLRHDEESYKMAQQSGSANKDTIIFLKAYSKIVPDFLARSSRGYRLQVQTVCRHEG
jgi:hypothetical protein